MAFARFPLLRLLGSFIAGILSYIYFSETPVLFKLESFYISTGIIVLYVLLVIAQFYFNLKTIVSLVADIALFILGYQLCYYQDLSHHSSFIGNKISFNETQLVIVKPKDVVVHKDQYSKLFVKSFKIYDAQKGKWENIKGDILVYSSFDLDSIYQPDAYYLLSAKLQAPSSSQNPYLFNYAEYLKKQDVYYVAYIKNKSELKFLHKQKILDIRELALITRYKIIKYFKSNVYLSETNKNIAIALLTGFDDELDNEIIQSFVYSGTLHILSVSGFHTGLLFLLITFIFSLIDPYKRWRWTRIILTIFILFFYAFLSGFAPPIVRAAIMLSLIVIQQYIYTDRILHPLNVLSAAAFFVLAYNPFYINDVGFLLSFSAMIGIVYFSPKMIFENKIVQNIWDIVSMSIGAQLGTLPFALYYFHGFAFLFFIANIIIIPLSTIIMFVAISALIPLSFLSIVLNYLISIMIYLNNWIANTKTYFDWIHFNFLDGFVLSVLIIGTSIFIKKIIEKEMHWIYLFNFIIGTIAIWIFVHHLIYLMNYQKKKIYLYIDKKQFKCWIQKENIIIFNKLDSADLNYWAKNLLLKNCIDKYSIYPFNFIQFKNKKIFIARQMIDTNIIIASKPNVIIWDIRKDWVFERFNYSTLEKIYLLETRRKAKTIYFDKVKVLKSGDFIEL
jgi:competence protein ComEC